MSGNIPNKIGEIRHQLAAQERLLEELKRSLEAAQCKYDRLKNKLAAYQSSTSVQGFPPEILSIIFGFTLSENPKHISRLLPVCRDWYEILVNHPQMWNVIQLEVPDDCWDILSWVEGARAYVRRCLELSHSTLLEVSLDFKLLQTIREQLISRLHSGFYNLPKTMRTKPDHYLLSSFLGSLDYWELENDHDTIMECQPEHILDLIDDLVRCSHRWKSLHVNFPSDKRMAEEVRRRVVGPWPNLTRLSFNDPHNLEQFLERTSPLCLPELGHLSLSTYGGDSRPLQHFPPSLYSISILTIVDAKFVRILSRFTQLRKLELINIGWAHEMRLDIVDTLSLPLLEELTLNNGFRPVNTVQFHLPRLARLVVAWSWRAVQETIPVLNPSHVYWKASWCIWTEHDIPSTPGDFQVAKVFLKKILLQFTRTQDLNVPAYMRDILFTLVRELASWECLPSAWQTMSFHRGQESVEIVEIKSILRVDR